MKKIKNTRQFIRTVSCIMAAWLAFIQPVSVLASEPEISEEPEDMEQSGENGLSEETDLPEENTETSARYITAFEALAEEDSYYSCTYKPMLEEVLGVFPEMLSVWLEGEDEPVELPVTWECEEDYEQTQLEVYTFYPKWDETQYAVADELREGMEIPAIVIEVPSGGNVIKNPEEARSGLQDILQRKAILASVYLCDEYEVKESPSPDSGTVRTVVSGQSVQITDVESDAYGNIWYRVLLYWNGGEYTGYVEKNYLATSDEDFAVWEETYLDLSAIPALMDLEDGYPDIDQFPASYQNALYALKEKHPEWTFVRIDTKLDWNTVIANEIGDKSWIPSSTAGSWQSGKAPQSGWSYASEGILKYYMDPRNFLTDPFIFQFEQLTYNSSYHTADAVQEILKDSFMASVIPDDSRTYAQAFTAIGQELGISPFHLTARVLQEQGTKGSSSLISGIYPGYQGYYNYYNISAYGKDNTEIIVRGLEKAKKEGWNTRYKSLYGGAGIIGNQYILKGQDTLYLEKFNVSNGGNANYTHQYMQNIQAPYKEAFHIRSAYSAAGVLERSFVFKIPVYENMPASACSQPEKLDTITLNKETVSGLAVDKTVKLIPYVNGSKVDHVNDMSFSSSNTAVATVDTKGTVTAISPGDATISCTRSGAGTAKCTVTVIKADPAVTTPVLSPVTYRKDLKLSDIPLPDGWIWTDGSASVSVGTPAFAAVYTPEDTVKYNEITRDISFTVTKAIPNCQVPSGLELKKGASLGSIMLPEGFAWESSVETVLTDIGEYTFYVSYNPDETNYYTVSHIPIIVQVKENVTGVPSDGEQDGSGNGGNGTGEGTGSGSSTGNGSGGNTSGGGTGGNGSTGSTGNGNSGSTGSGTGNGSAGGNSGNTAGSDSNGNTTGSGTGGNGSTGSTGNGNSGSTGSGTGNGSAGGNSGNTAGSDSNGNTSGSGTGGNGSTGSTGSGNSGSTGSGSSTGSSNNESTTGSGSHGSTDNGTGNGSAGNVSAGSGQQGSSSADNAQQGNSSTGNNTQQGSTSAGNTQTGNVTGTSSEATAGSSAEITDQNTEGTEENAASENEGGESSEQREEENHYRPAVTIQMEDTTILTTEKLQMAKEQNFDLLLDMGGAVTWSIDVDSVDESVMTEVDMGVTLGTENVPKEVVSSILDGNKYLEITLAHEGAFGFEPVLNVALGTEYSGQYANLFYYDPESETLEFICDAVIGPDGVASLRFDHASCYLIVVSDQSMSGVALDDESVNPWTRWIVIGVFVCMLLVVAGCGIFFFLKKRHEEDDEDDDDEYEDDEDEYESDSEKYEADEYADQEEENEYADEDEGYGEEEYEDDRDYEKYEYEEEGMEDGGVAYVDEENIYEDDEDTYESDGDEYVDEDETEKKYKNDIRIISTGRNSVSKENGSAKVSLIQLSVEEEDDGYFDEDDEDDWIDDEDWHEPEADGKSPVENSSNVYNEDDWIDDDEWNAEDDWIEDDEWVEEGKR